MGSPNTEVFNHETLTREEIRAVVEEAHKGGHRVVAHAQTKEGARNAVESGVDSIEHGSAVDKETFALMAKKDIVLVPTLAAQSEGYDTAARTPGQEQLARDGLQKLRDKIANAKAAHVKIASGFDAAEEPLQGKNANELVALVRFGLTPIEAIRAATVTASELAQTSDSVGSIDKGNTPT